MVKVNIYPACLECGCSKFVDKTESRFPWSWDSNDHNAHIKCEYERICKFIDGQELIEIGE